MTKQTGREVFVGLDLSVRSTGMVAIACDAELLFHEAFGSQKDKSQSNANLDKIVRARKVCDMVSANFQALEVKYPACSFRIALEGYAYGMRNTSSLADLAQLGGLVQDMLRDEYEYPLIVATSQLKKFASGKGNTKKVMIPAEVVARWKLQFKTTDEVDAYVLSRICLAYYQVMRNEVTIPLTKPQQAVVDALRQTQ